MSIKACPTPNPECPWYSRPTPDNLVGKQEHGCFSDQDHVIPRFLGRRAIREDRKLVYNYLRLPENKQQICRWEHDEKSVEELASPPELPSLEVMKEAIDRRAA